MDFFYVGIRKIIENFSILKSNMAENYFKIKIWNKSYFELLFLLFVIWSNEYSSTTIRCDVIPMRNDNTRENRTKMFSNFYY